MVPVGQNIRLEWHARAKNKKVKRVLLGLNLEENMIREIANELGCELGEWPLKYLGTLWQSV